MSKYIDVVYQIKEDNFGYKYQWAISTQLKHQLKLKLKYHSHNFVSCRPTQNVSGASDM